MIERIPFITEVEQIVAETLDDVVVCELSVLLPKAMVKRNDCVLCYGRHCKYYIPIKVYEVLK